MLMRRSLLRFAIAVLVFSASNTHAPAPNAAGVNR
jgi:hypothetical protein